MANPNLLDAVTIRGKSVIIDLATTSTIFLTNTTGSGQLYKINSITAVNKGSAVADVTLQVSKNGTLFTLANRLGVPVKSNLVVMSKELQFYLEENDYFQATSSLASSLVLICSYETIQ